MAKILTDTELLDIVRKTVLEEELDEAHVYRLFLEGLAGVIAEFYGGEAGQASEPYYSGLGWTFAFNINDCVPDDGGIFKDYDKDVTWKDGEEI
jgi:hypothetical protein